MEEGTDAMINPIVASLKHEVEILRSGKLCKPRMAIVTPTYACNQSCHYCFFKHKNNGHIMSHENLKIMIDQIAELGIESIEWCGGGESLLVPEIDKIFSYAHSKGLKLGLLTNGVLFDGKIAETFLKYGTYVRFSIDTVNPKKYKEIRGTDDCAIVLSNIEKAVRIKQKYDYMCQISLKIGYSDKLDLTDIQCVFDFAAGKRIYSIQIKNVWDENGTYLNDELQRNDLYRDLKTHNIRFSKKISAKKMLHEQCWINPVQVTIDAYGNCYLCCYYQYRAEKHSFGNIFKVKLKDLWGSPEHLKCIASSSIDECNKHDCRFIRYQDMIRHQLRSSDWSFV